MPFFWWFRKKKKKKKDEGFHPLHEFDDGLFRGIVRGLTGAPESQLSERLRLECVELLETSPSEAECYDLLDRISKEPCFKISDKVCLGEISSFTQKLCDVTAHYPRPEDASNIGNAPNGRD